MRTRWFKRPVLPRAGKTFPRALLLAVVLVIAMYLLPLMACLGVMPEAADWKLGFFATVARRVGGPWLAWWMLAAAAVRSLPRA
jgi:amino acid transporter